MSICQIAAYAYFFEYDVRTGFYQRIKVKTLVNATSLKTTN